eukprot:CAMPEP_0197020362 /NCGR_PEP_ID=MMETSP1384-20130603/1126_1 /TAXON_ID=29189 /ORGANISM="Ammonia sp." /LENGTH=448 /DNA_ID=CAMNT_0042447971 /DNA_START=28 /DNA_END=1371 /DNA_ORIENTATION=-
MALSDSQQEALSTFMAMTNAETEVAKAFLKATSWDINTAMDRFYAFDGDASKLAPPASSNNNGAPSIQPGPTTGLVSQTANLISGALGGIFGGGQPPPQPQTSSVAHYNLPQPAPQPTTGVTQADQDALLAQQLAAQGDPSQPFVRAPDAAYADRLVGPYTNQYGSSLYRQRVEAQQNFAKDWQKGPKNNKSSFLGALFSDPGYKFVGSLEDAKKKGARENKWILINIQDTENFCSHCLNRDIWKDDDLAPVISAAFVFYQWVEKSDNAKRVINLYHPQHIPCIFVVDPNTGRLEQEFPVPDQPDKISLLKPKLLEFLDNYPNPKAKPKKVVPVSIPTKAMAPQLPEDEELQKAIQASLMESKEDELEQATQSNAAMEQDHDEEQTQEQDKQASPMQQDEVAEEEETLEPEPEEKGANAAAIRIRLPNGGILQRWFNKESKVSQLYVW